MNKIIYKLYKDINISNHLLKDYVFQILHMHEGFRWDIGLEYKYYKPKCKDMRIISLHRPAIFPFCQKSLSLRGNEREEDNIACRVITYRSPYNIRQIEASLLEWSINWEGWRENPFQKFYEKTSVNTSRRK